ncbi:MAG: molecular chaperone SurA, partial [Luminiphilus sp.]|nr:molecular chaperone SurA [Luminiphilus sp.]
MLNVRFKSVVTASIATLATLSATAPSIAFAQVIPLDTIVAIVDEDIILASEVRDRVKQVKSSAEQRDIPLPD